MKIHFSLVASLALLSLSLGACSKENPESTELAGASLAGRMAHQEKNTVRLPKGTVVRFTLNASKEVVMESGGPGVAPNQVSLGGYAAGKPTAARFGDGNDMLVFVQGSDGAIWVNQIHNGSPLGWVSGGGLLAANDKLTATQISQYSVEVTGQGIDGQIYYNYYSHSIGFHGWSALPGR
jgi:hypothetical protein